MSLLHHPEPDPYYAEVSPPLRAWRIMDRSGHLVDIVRSPRVAAYDVDLLNTGRAHVNVHGLLGCRVVLSAVAA
jgi:hypothetical protein